MLLSNSTIDIGLRLSLIDKFSKPAADVKAAMKGVRDEMQMYQDNLRAARNLYGGVAVAGAAAMTAMWSGFEQGAKFDYMIRGAAAAAGATGKELSELNKQASTLGSQMGFMPEDIASAMRTLGLAGIDAKGIMVGIRPIMALAGGSMEDLATSADIAVSAMYQFGLQAKDLGYIGDVLAQGSVKSNIAIKDLAESLKYSASTAVLLKQDLPTVTAMIMTLGNAGVKGSMAGVTVENMYRYLGIAVNQYKKTGGSKALARLGISAKDLIDAKGDLRPIVDILDTLSNSLNKFGSVQQGNFLFEIFGVRGKRGPAVFIEDMKALRRNLELVNNAKGVSESMYEKQMAGPYGAIIRMKAAFAEMIIGFTQAVAPVVLPFLKILTGVLQGLKSFMDTAAGKLITPLLVGLTTMVTVIAALRAGLATLALTLGWVRTSLAGMGGSLAIARATWLPTMLGMGVMPYRPNVPNAPYNTATSWNPHRPWVASTPYPWNSPGYAANQFSRTGQIGSMGGPMGPYSSTTATGQRYTVTPGMGTTFATGNWTPPAKSGWMGGLGKGVIGAGTSIGGAIGMSAGIGNMMAGQSTGQKIGGGMQAIGGGLLMFGPDPITKGIGAGLLLVGTGLAIFSTDEKQNTSALRDNTRALKDDTLTRLRVTMGGRETLSWTEYARERMRGGSSSKEAITSLAQQLQIYLANPKLFGNKFIDTSQPGVINLYVGDQISKVINRQMNNTLNANLMK